MAQENIEYYKDGGVKSKGYIADGGMDGYWEWFRKNGTKMRSGHAAPPTQGPSAITVRAGPQVEDPVAAGGNLGVVGGQDQGPAAGGHLEEPGQDDGP
jgi:hypothetical protein